jgi:hypothetical protein
MLTIPRQLERALEMLSSRFGSAKDILEAFTELGISEGIYLWDNENGEWLFEPHHSGSQPVTDIGLARIYFEVAQNSLGYSFRVGNNHYVDIYLTLSGEIIDLIPDPAVSHRCWRGMEYEQRHDWCCQY